MHVHVPVIKPASSKLGSARCQWIIVIDGRGLPAISSAAAVHLPQGFGLIDLHRPAIIVGAVEAIDCRLSFRFTHHFDEAKDPALASVTIGNQLDGLHGSVCREFDRKILLGR